MANKHVKNAVLLMGIVIGSKIIGFLREVLLAYFYGATNITDAYVIATSIYTLLFSAISTAITTSYIQKMSSKKDVYEKNIFTTKLILFLSGIILTISLIGCLFPELLIKLFAYGFDEITLDLAITMILIILPVTFITGIYYIFSAYMQTKNIFWFSGITLLLTNTFIILGIIFSNNNHYILALGNVVGTIVCGIVGYLCVSKFGFKFKWSSKNNQEIKSLFILAVPIFIGQLVQQINIIVDRNFASSLGEGVISSINYANKVNTLFITMFVVSITTVLFPSLSKLSTDNKDEFNKISIKTGKVISMFAFPVAIGITLLSEEIVKLLFLRGQFTMEDVVVTSQILRIYALGIPALSLNEILNKQFYALGDTKTPVSLSVISLLVNIGLNFVLVKNLGYTGLACSTSISVWLLFILLNVKFNNKYKFNILKENRKNLLIITIATTIMAMIISLIKNILPITNQLIIVGLCGIVGVLVYFIVLIVFKDEEIKVVINRILRRK